MPDYRPFGATAGLVMPFSIAQFGGMTPIGRLPLLNSLMRVYRTDIGRYLQRDPLGMGPDQNLYTYVGNNPVARFDAFGLAPSEDIDLDLGHVDLSAVTELPGGGFDFHEGMSSGFGFTLISPSVEVAKGASVEYRSTQFSNRQEYKAKLNLWKFVLEFSGTDPMADSSVSPSYQLKLGGKWSLDDILKGRATAILKKLEAWGMCPELTISFGVKLNPWKLDDLGSYAFVEEVALGLKGGPELSLSADTGTGAKLALKTKLESAKLGGVSMKPGIESTLWKSSNRWLIQLAEAKPFNKPSFFEAWEAQLEANHLVRTLEAQLGSLDELIARERPELVPLVSITAGRPPHDITIYQHSIRVGR
jgi:RHS repeat-associated protein